MQAHDIIFLQETWIQEQDNLSIQGYKTFSVPATKIHTKGRGRGGLVTFLSVDLKVDVSILENNQSNNFQVLFVKGLFPRSLICINVYIPPNSGKSQGEDPWDSLVDTIESLLFYYPSSYIIVGGDFNARIGSGAVDVRGNKSTQIATQAYLLDRSSKDRVVNKFGLKLLKLLSLANLYLLHGTNLDITGGTYTYLSTHRASTIDYIAVSSDILNQVDKFEVVDNSLSDHCPLRLTLKSTSDNFLKPVPDLADDTIPGSRSLKWSDQLQSKFSQFLANPEMEFLRHAILQAGNDSTPIWESITTLLKPFLVNNRPIKPTSYTNNGWFDQECKTFKKEITHIMRKARGNNNEIWMPQLLYLRSQYKKLIKQKKLNYAKTLWKELDLAVSGKNETRFWTLISNSLNTWSHQLEAQIPAKDWVLHFSKVFGAHLALPPITSPHLQYIPSDLADLPVWPTVTEAEINDLISSLTSGKSPGEDLIPADLYKAFPSWWSPVLAKTFSQINNTGQIPPGWKLSIVVPIYKKGDKSAPNNYRPISLLDIAAKMYSKYLLIKLEEWVDENHILYPHQAGFRKGLSTIDHCQTLQQLVFSGINGLRKELYVAFVDLAASFDSIDRHRLWQKLADLNIDKRLLFLLRELHLDTHAQIRVGISGSLTNKIPTCKGVKQGCVLAPLLFNLYINNIVERLFGPRFVSPTLGDQKRSILLYADDMALISLTKIGMQRLLQQLGAYCKDEALNINYDKTKVMVFRKRAKKFSWSVLGNSISQCMSFKYLGITFSENLNWKLHLATIRASATSLVGAILKFYYTKGGFLIDPVLKLYKCKVIPHLLYGVEVWGWKENNISRLETVQNTFLRRILALPRGTPAALMRAETGLPSLSARVHSAILKLWKNHRLAKSNKFSHQSFKIMLSKDAARHSLVNSLLARYSIPDDLLNPLVNNSELRDWIFKSDAQIDRSQILQTKSASWFKQFKYDHRRSSYLIKIPNHNLRAAFTSLRFETMPTEILAGRYSCTPKNQRLCICGAQALEDLPHYIFDCSLYVHPRAKFLDEILHGPNFYSFAEKLIYLLSDRVDSVTYKTSLFALAARKIRASVVTVKAGS